MARVARALQLLIPQPDQESEFRETAQLILDHWNDIAGLAPEALAGQMSTRGLLSRDDGTILALLIEVAQTALLPHLAGEKARRYLAALVVELAIREPDLTGDRAFQDLARVIRLELVALRKDDAARPPIPDPHSLLALVDWVERQPQKSDRFPDYFWGSWRKVLHEAALRVVYAAADETTLLAEDDSDPTEPAAFVFPPPPDERGEEPDLIGLIPPDPEPDPARRRGPGLQRAISEALLSTYTPLELLSEASTTVLTDAEVRSTAADLVREFDAALQAGDLSRAESTAGLALTLTTGTALLQIPQLRWVNPGDAPIRPAGISADARWLVRPQLVPEVAAGADSGREQCARSVWIPLPESLRQRLLRLHPKPQVGAAIFSALKGRPPLPGARADVTTLRRTFFARMARLEPLGITGAQWATGDDFGLDTAPLHYDRFPADALARLIESVTFPWFGERVGAARPNRPTHTLGSRVVVDPASLREYFSTLRTAIPAPTDLPAVIERLRVRSRNLAHGFMAVTGHRPNDAIGEITLAQLDIVDGIGIVQDKRVAPDWPHRPVALPGSICAEVNELVRDLRRAFSLAPDSPLGRAAVAAATGAGPIFLRIDSADRVSPYTRADYLQDVPKAIAVHPNFARHLLNQSLIGRVPEALRVGQLGWHGTREGAWAETSPWSVRSAAAELHSPVERHLAALGWSPLQRPTTSREKMPVGAVSWVDQEQERRREFARATARLRQIHAERLHQTAKDLLPALQMAVRTQWPNLVIDGHFSLKLANDESKGPIHVTPSELTRIEVLVAPGDSRSHARAALRNVLGVAFRRGQALSLVAGALPRRIHWRVSTGPRPTDFLWCAPLALRQCRHLDQWLSDKATWISLSARTVLSLLLHGGYGDLSAIAAAMHPDTTLGRTHAYPDVVLANAPEMPSENGFSHRTLAFHDLAALALERWHRVRGATTLDLDLVSSELKDAIPAHVFSASSHALLDELTALARARNSLTMDGIARMVGTGVCRISSVSSDRIAAVHDHHPVTRTAEPRDETVAPVRPDASADATSPEAQPAATVRTLMAFLSGVQTRRRPKTMTEAEARRRLRSDSASLLRNRPGETRVVDLLARFVVALLDEGGDRREALELSTIQGYVAPIAYPLNAGLGDHPLARDAGDWQEVYFRIVASTTPAMRHPKALALRRFHTVLSRHLPLPDVDLPALGLLSGTPLAVDAAALLSAAERRAVSDQLVRDTAQLAAQGADPEEIHTAGAREVYLPTLSASSLRPGEAWSLLLGNVALGTEGASVCVSRHRWQRLKTPRSRRRVRLRGGEAAYAQAQLEHWVAEVRRRVGAAARDSLPIFGRIDDPETPIAFELFAARIGPLMRWITDDPNAVPYAMRKTGIHEALPPLHRLAPTSLWPLRDYLKRSAHGSFTVTIPCYLHDPLVIFDRWFRSGSGRLDSASLSIASGRSVSRIRRSSGRGSIHGGRLKEWRNRVAQLLDRVPYLAPVAGMVHPAPALRPKSWFLASVEELDQVLRDLARGGELREITMRRAWPSSAHSRLAQLLNLMATDLLVGFGKGIPGMSVQITPPRRLSKVLTNSKEDPAPLWGDLRSEVLAEMGGTWLRNAALPGLPDGIPALASDWERWHQIIGTDFSRPWASRKLGPLDCRALPAPEGSSLSPWPLLRWEIVLRWMVARLSAPATVMTNHPSE